jgi:plasmid stabilization system protein ParE
MVAADQFFLDMYRKVESFARDGLTGTNRGEFGSGIRSFAYHERIIFFHLSDTELTVPRVLHGRQDISSKYFKTDQD